MILKTEAHVKKAFSKMLKKFPNIFYYYPGASVYGKAGIPDVVICFTGLFIGVELKAPDRKDKMTPLQKKVKEEIELAHGEHWLVYDQQTIDEAEDALIHISEQQAAIAEIVSKQQAAIAEIVEECW